MSSSGTGPLAAKQQCWGSPWHWLGSALLYSLLALVATWPLALQAGHSCIGTNHDHFFAAWQVRWFKTAVVDLGIRPTFQPWMNYPTGYDLGHISLMPAQLMISLPFTVLGSEVLGYNATMFFSTILSGLSMSAWAYYHTRRWDASLVAGVTFAFLPYRTAHGDGHLELVGTQWLPVCMFGVDALLDRRGGWRASVLLGLGYGLTALTAQYYMYMTLIMLIPYLVLALGRRGWRQAMGHWRHWLLAGAIALPLLALAEWPYLRVAMSGESARAEFSRSFGYIARWGANPYDLFRPPVDHFLWPDRNWYHAYIEAQELTLYAGALTLVMTAIGLVQHWRGRMRLPQLPRLLGCALIAVVLTLGPVLFWRGQIVQMPTPTVLQAHVDGPTMPVPMPALLLIKTLPFYSAMRVNPRFGLYADMLLCLLMALVLAPLLDMIKVRRWRSALTVLLVVLVMVDFYQGPPVLSTVGPRPVDLWLAEQPQDGALVNLPALRNIVGADIYYASYASKPYLGSFSSAKSTPQARELYRTLLEPPSTGMLDYLRARGARYLNVNLADYDDPEQIAAALSNLGLTVAYRDASKVVFAIDSARRFDMPGAR